MESYLGRTVRNIAIGIGVAAAAVATGGLAFIAAGGAAAGLAAFGAAAYAAGSVALVGAQYLMRPSGGASMGASLPMPTASVVGPPPTPLRKTLRQADVPRCFIFGRTRTSGAYFFYETDTNQNLYQGIYICDGPVDGFDGFLCDDEAFGCGSTGPTRTSKAADGNDNVYIPTDGIKFIKSPYNPAVAPTTTPAFDFQGHFIGWSTSGGSAESTDTIINCSCIAFEPVSGSVSGNSSYILNTLMKSSGYNVSSNMNNVWTTNHLGKGITCLYTFASTFKTTAALRLKYFPNGWPEWSMALRGAKMYDPRKDTSNGGFGSHKYLQSDIWTIYNPTWEWSENPAIIAAHYIAWLISQKLTAIIGIDWASIRQAANDCDAAISVNKLNYGTTKEPFARVSAVYYFNTPPREFLSNLMASCDGSYDIDQNGLFTMWIGKWELPEVTFTENDIGGFTEEFVESATEAVNELHITYIEPRQNYQKYEAPTYRDTTSQALVGKHISSLDFNIVPSPTQAYRLGQRFAKRINGKRKINITLGPRGMLAIKQRVVDISAPNFGIVQTSGVAWRVESLSPADATLAKWTATLREITTDVFSDTSPNDPISNLYLVSQKALAAPQTISVQSQFISSTSEILIASIDLNYNSSTTPTATVNTLALLQEQTLTAIFEYSLNGGATWTSFSTVLNSNTSSQNFNNGSGTVSVRSKFIALNGSASSYSATVTYTLGNKTSKIKALHIQDVYVITLNRFGDDAGITYWINQYNSGTSLATICSNFLSGAEYTSLYPTQTNAQFIQMIYNNFYDRSPTTAESTYWVGQLTSGVSRAQAVADFITAVEVI